jgi:hypothetical protein
MQARAIEVAERFNIAVILPDGRHLDADRFPFMRKTVNGKSISKDDLYRFSDHPRICSQIGPVSAKYGRLYIYTCSEGKKNFRKKYAKNYCNNSAKRIILAQTVKQIAQERVYENRKP